MDITTPRLFLRPLCVEDAEAYHRMTEDKAIREYVPYAYGETMEETRELLEAYQKGNFIDDFYYAIIERQTKTLVGAMIATRDRGAELSIAYFVEETSRGKGYCKEALRGFAKMVRCYTRWRTLVFDIKSSNHSSIRIMEKLSALIVGREEGSLTYVINL